MNSHEPKFGAKVTFTIAGKPYVGRVVEERGPIGLGGRRLYRIFYQLGEGNWKETELPIDEIDEFENSTLNRRKLRELEYIYAVEAVEAHSIFLEPNHAESFTKFLKEQNVRFYTDPNAIPGEINVLVDKSTPWMSLLALLTVWKLRCAEDSA